MLIFPPFWLTFFFLVLILCKEYFLYSFSNFNSWKSSLGYYMSDFLGPFIAHLLCCALDLSIDEALMMACPGPSVCVYQCHENSHCMRSALHQVWPAPLVQLLLTALSRLLHLPSYLWWWCFATWVMFLQLSSYSLCWSLGHAPKLKFLPISIFWWESENELTISSDSVLENRGVGFALYLKIEPL